LSSTKRAFDCENAKAKRGKAVFESKVRFESLVASLEASRPRLTKHQLVEIRKMVTSQFVKHFKKSFIPEFAASTIFLGDLHKTVYMFGTD
jgi:hypothetical protein